MILQPEVAHHPPPQRFRAGYIKVEGLEWEAQLKRSEMTLPDGRKVDPKEYYESSPES